MPPLALWQRQLWISSRKLAQKQLGHAKQLLSSQDPADLQVALGLVDSALKLFPQWERALELKARLLLCLRRYKDIANLLQELIPSFKAQQPLLEDPIEDKIKLLPRPIARQTTKSSPAQCFSLFTLHKKLWFGQSAKADKEQWKYILLGQACCHLGMMEDAMILLSNGKQAASAAYRKQSSCQNEDNFLTESAHGSESDLVSNLIGNIKLLLRRRTAALAALDAGLYIEAGRHFSKIIDGRRGTPQGFIADCYMHRATAYFAANRIVDALADCNRSLALNPMCAEALSTRATLYESLGCLSDAMEDLHKLRNLYEAVFQNDNRWIHSHTSPSFDLQGCIDFVRSKVVCMSERGHARRGMVDHHKILNVSRGCSRAEVERAYLLLCLKHRPDKAAHFVDRCEFVDERNIEAVKEEARFLGFKLFRLLQKAYMRITSAMLEEESIRERHLQKAMAAVGQGNSIDGSLLFCEAGFTAKSDIFDSWSDGGDGEEQSSLLKDSMVGPFNEVWLGQGEGSCPHKSPFKHGRLDNDQSMCEFSDMGDVGQLVDASLFAQTSTCRELANVSSVILLQGLPPEAWMRSNEWNLSVQPLSVT